MKVFIKQLKKGDKFKFNHKTYIIKQKYADWKRNEEPYLVTVCGTVFTFDELEVEKV